MIRAKDIQEAFLHLVGWENDNSSTAQIDESLTQSESGMYFQQAHPLLTLENVCSIAPDFKRIFGQENATEQLSKWLEKKTKASIYKAIMYFYNNKLANKTTKNLLENKTFFDGTGRITDTINNHNNLVGFEITPIRSKGVTTKINKIGLQFTEPGAYKIYIFHSSKYEPVYVLDFEKKNKNSMEWFVTNDVYLPYLSDGTDAGGSWFLCYFQSDIPEGSKAIRKVKDWSKKPCSGCSRTEFESWKAWSRFIEVHPFYVNEELVRSQVEKPSDIGLWDIDENVYDYSTNCGINLDITVSCDYTDFLIEQRSMFTDVIMKQVAVDMLREFVYNPSVRTNRNSINASRSDILYEIDGDSSSMKKSGLSYQLSLAYEAIDISTRGIDRICLPCKNNGVRFTAI